MPHTENNIKNPFIWSDSATKFFLTLYKEKILLLKKRKIKTKIMMWKKIAQEMQSKGYDVYVTYKLKISIPPWKEDIKI